MPPTNADDSHEDLQRPTPYDFLTIVDLSQIQRRPLRRLVLPHAPVLHHAEITVVLAILFSDLGAKKHLSSPPCQTSIVIERGQVGTAPIAKDGLEQVKQSVTSSA